jgi:hypothetical protein
MTNEQETEQPTLPPLCNAYITRRQEREGVLAFTVQDRSCTFILSKFIL